MDRYPRIQFNRLKMYFGDDYTIDLEGIQGSITIHQPSINDVAELGEDKFFATLSVFINNTTAAKLMLWEIGIDWNEIRDFDLFCLTMQAIDPDVSKVFFGDLDWSSFELVSKHVGEEEEVVLYSSSSDIEINEDVYQHIHQYLQTMFNMTPEVKFTNTKFLKEQWIRQDRIAAKLRAEKKDAEVKTSLQSMISSYINHPGTSYKLQELRQVGVCEFYDAIARLQIYEQTTALQKGMYSGFCDTSKIKPEDYNWMKDINK